MQLTTMSGQEPDSMKGGGAPATNPAQFGSNEEKDKEGWEVALEWPRPPPAQEVFHALVN